MDVKLAGIQGVNFINSNGEPVRGTNIYCLFKDEHVDGMKCSKFFVKDTIPLTNIKPNDSIALSFNMNGKVDGVTKL